MKSDDYLGNSLNNLYPFVIMIILMNRIWRLPEEPANSGLLFRFFGVTIRILLLLSAWLRSDPIRD